MSTELQEALHNLYERFNTQRVNAIKEAFEREFSENNVQVIIEAPRPESQFIDAIMESFHMCQDGENCILCSMNYEENNDLDFICAIPDIEDELQMSYEEAFATIKDEDLYAALHTFNKLHQVYVHFPLVKITNERGQFTYVKDLFTRTSFWSSGIMEERIQINRSHYTYAHFINNYMHSHVCDIPTTNFEQFQYCCLGSGPINETIANLQEEYSEAQWIQYCWDMAKYVTVESIEGRPYHLLSRCNSSMEKGQEIKLTNLSLTLGSFRTYSNLLPRGRRLPDDFWVEFTKYLVNNKIFKFRWAHKQWEISESPTEYLNTISTAFLRYYQSRLPEITNTFHDHAAVLSTLLSCNILNRAFVDITGVYQFVQNGSLNREYVERSRGQHVINFKGVDYNVVIDEPEGEAHTQIILNPKIVAIITGNILKTLNTEYGKRSEALVSEPEIPFENL